MTTQLKPMAQLQPNELKKSLVPRTDLPYLLKIMEIDTSSKEGFLASLPFCVRDTTAGTENEFQAVVVGKRHDLDLAITIEESNYYKNIVRRAASGDTSRKKMLGLERYLNHRTDDVWENSWVRFPRKTLNTYANHIFNADLKADKTNPASALRSDAQSFTFIKENESFVRIPVSYLLKLALADALGAVEVGHPLVRSTGEQMMAHFSNDNTSPEIFSFYPVGANGVESLGQRLAKETLIRFLFTQLLVQYAQKKFCLKEQGQQVKIFFSSSPPLMQKQLNDNISDSFYRSLFMSPCLSGWTRGQEKHEYMKLCHTVLSRSQLNSLSKLREAGIINTNLVVLPNTSNVCLANNGTHISMGSLKLKRLLKDPGSGYTSFHEKYLGDLVIKIKEHFLCLFPGVYSASPLRLSFEDFHPEKALGFLPHEIDYTHLRMIWRRWKRKAKIHVFGQAITPFGPVWLDRLLSHSFGLKGDFIPDARLIDYFVSLMSTDQSPSLNGAPGNEAQLKKDLSQMGVYDERMPLYQLVRIRKHAEMGYTGFEHRYFSIFENLGSDMGGAVDLQHLITALAYHYILTGKITHEMIPDTPDVESERRQIFFCSAINIPTCYVKTKTRNLFLQQIVAKIPKTRVSRRYPGYTRIRLLDYKKTLIKLIQTDGKELVQSFSMEATLSDLGERIRDPDTFSVAGKLNRGILKKEKKKDPMRFRGDIFNKKAEDFYINDLREQQMEESFAALKKEFHQMDVWVSHDQSPHREAIKTILGEKDLYTFLADVEAGVLDHSLDLIALKKLLYLIMLYVNMENKNETSPPPVY